MSDVYGCEHIHEALPADTVDWRRQTIPFARTVHLLFSSPERSSNKSLKLRCRLARLSQQRGDGRRKAYRFVRVVRFGLLPMAFCNLDGLPTSAAFTATFACCIVPTRHVPARSTPAGAAMGGVVLLRSPLPPSAGGQRSTGRSLHRRRKGGAQMPRAAVDLRRSAGDPLGRHWATVALGRPWHAARDPR